MSLNLSYETRYKCDVLPRFVGYIEKICKQMYDEVVFKLNYVLNTLNELDKWSIEGKLIFEIHKDENKKVYVVKPSGNVVFKALNFPVKEISLPSKLLTEASSDVILKEILLKYDEFRKLYEKFKDNKINFSEIEISKNKVSIRTLDGDVIELPWDLIKYIEILSRYVFINLIDVVKSIKVSEELNYSELLEKLTQLLSVRLISYEIFLAYLIKFGFSRESVVKSLEKVKYRLLSRVLFNFFNVLLNYVGGADTNIELSKIHDLAMILRSYLDTSEIKAYVNYENIINYPKLLESLIMAHSKTFNEDLLKNILALVNDIVKIGSKHSYVEITFPSPVSDTYPKIIINTPICKIMLTPLEIKIEPHVYLKNVLFNEIISYVRTNMSKLIQEEEKEIEESKWKVKFEHEIEENEF